MSVLFRTHRFFVSFVLVAVFVPSVVAGGRAPSNSDKHDLRFKSLARTWDEGIPLGNGMIGALIWRRDSVLRMSLDRADLWDLRKIKEFERPDFRFAWVVEQATKGDYKRAQEMGDVPYNRDAAPTKLPGAALELAIPGIDDVEFVRLHLDNALCTIRWKSGVELKTFVHATEPRGWFRVTGLREEIKPRLIPPPYSLPDTSTQTANSGPGGNDLRRLGYPPPNLTERKNTLMYRQECEGGFSYLVDLSWSMDEDNILTGVWQIHPSKSFALKETPKKTGVVQFTGRTSFDKDFKTHAEWWHRYWQQCSIHLPDSVLETQWYREMYKFGSASRRGAPPITLQAVWTADNGRLPPWKGDFHHDLNTQLSYWPAYSSNHLAEESAFLDWLWWCKPVAERYTSRYFGTSGLDFAGVSTLTGEPMGGWIQYSLSPTVSAWLSHHFYLHWRYSLDRAFLRDRAYPWIRAVAVHLNELSLRDENGRRKLPLSASPEINDNRVEAWFRETTNYDLALVRWLFGAASELATELGKNEEAARWKVIQSEWPGLATAPGEGKLLVAPGIELKESHRHFSHLMAIHPLGLLDWDRGDPDKHIISASLSDLERLGTDWWCGYSYAWLGSMWARTRNGEKAAEALRTFATCFCLPNSFHVNGDQSGTGKSKFTYRPFTLEGNFACAAGIQEMLLQSHNGVLRIFPAIPESWQDVSFNTMRAEGALLVSAVRAGGKTRSVKIASEKGGIVKMINPFAGDNFKTKVRGGAKVQTEGRFLRFKLMPADAIEFVLE